MTGPTELRRIINFRLNIATHRYSIYSGKISDFHILQVVYVQCYQTKIKKQFVLNQYYSLKFVSTVLWIARSVLLLEMFNLLELLLSPADFKHIEICKT